MEIILNNPYRILGILVGATAKEQDRQLRRLRQFLAADQEPESDYSFPVVGKCERTAEKLNEAVSKLNLENDKMESALFWFMKGNDITDDPAFENLKDSDVSAAAEIWNKLIASGEVNKRNYSAFLNQSTLLLSRSYNGKLIDFENFSKAVHLKLQFLESDFASELKIAATDITFKADKKDLQLIFLNKLIQEISNQNSLPLSQLAKMLKRENFSAKEQFMKSLVQKPIEQIEKLIESTKSKRKTDRANAASAGKNFVKEVSPLMPVIEDILGRDNFKFTSVSDKVAEETLQCAIDYFNHYQNTGTDPGKEAYELCLQAERYAVSEMIRQRCHENTETIKEWIDDAPGRESRSAIIGEIEKLGELLKRFESAADTIANSRILLNSAQPLLSKIKSVLGSNDEFFIIVSTRVAAVAQGMCVGEINDLTTRFANTHNQYVQRSIFESLQEKVVSAWEVTTIIEKMDLDPEFRKNFLTNKRSLQDLKSKITPSPNNYSNSNKSGGCYIATMAYGNYDHPQVLRLRKFRDNRLAVSFWGRLLIRFYYIISPKAVYLLKDNKKINTAIRRFLDNFIEKIKV